MSERRQDDRRVGVTSRRKFQQGVKNKRRMNIRGFTGRRSTDTVPFYKLPQKIQERRAGKSERREFRDPNYLHTRRQGYTSYRGRRSTDTTDYTNLPIRPQTVTWGAGGYVDEPMLRYFGFSHLPPKLQEVSREFHTLATTIISNVPRNTERTVALRKLLEAKDAAVRAALD